MVFKAADQHRISGGLRLQMTLADLIPDVDLLLRLPPELVAKQLLKLAAKNLQNGSFSIGAITGRDYLFGNGFSPSRGKTYAQQNVDDVELAVGEAWHWLENAMLIMPEAAPNASFKRLTRRGRALVNDDSQFESFIAAAAFPKSLIHPLILDEVWLQLAQGKWTLLFLLRSERSRRPFAMLRDTLFPTMVFL
jgi:hypothetical protein